MTNYPLISIITPSFNSGQYIERAIQSVLCQDYDNWEHIIVDGCSTDGTLEILNKYPHLKWVSEPDMGIYDAMNKGIRLANGDWLYFLGADDEIFNNETFSVVSLNLIDKRDVIYGNVKFKHSNIIYDGKFTAKKLLLRNICHQSIFYKKSLIEQFGGFETKYNMLSDWHLNMKWFNDGNVKKKFIREIIAIYNEDGSCFNVRDEAFSNDWGYNVNRYFPKYIFLFRRFKPHLILSKILRILRF